ncbi:family 20 glycosylhydrolase [Salinibacterium soli]|uniref:beta-N-acetylhexosaminidase n=1 Tax=Antiquaquibacter soli TaxID=3064523 RepID=A0ABT9BRM0_9MICO|nr:family 20 glycosylhydrolase [Protaetiibacter sp. WY-16]MDO7883681.1 family 20 glycosylhydrolase [Protaetiibacter sp. WY-16]
MGVNVVPQPVSVIEREGSSRADALDVSVHGGLPSSASGSAHPEGYTLDVAPDGIRIEAADDAGAFYARQTLAQLTDAEGRVPHVHIDDFPRFAYRGAMLDVARHFFPVAAVKRYLDDIALLKLNHLHLHLTDDQGWRLQLDSWPELTGIGASTQVGGGGGGFYTADDYREIVEYAASRFITIVPEFDMPGHTNAAIAAYPELGDAPAEPYEGIEVGFSSLAIRSERTYEFVADALRELAALTPGPYLHLGGDESLATTDEDFQYFIARATAIGAATGKTLIGWHEMGRSRELPPGTIGQYWSYTTPQEGAAEHTLSFVEQGGRVILSPADAIYLDHKYDESTELGLEWANGPTGIRDSYEWEPADVVPGLAEHDILGIEAPMWTETLSTIDQVETMAFPRLASAAELAWSPRAPRVFAEFEPRLAAFTGYLDRLGVGHA